MTAAEERAALKDLVESDGWRLYMAHIQERWGPEAQLQEIRTSLADTPPDEERALVSRIMDAFAAVRADAHWPHEQIRILSGEAPTPRRSGLFGAFQRSRVGA